MCVGVVVEDVWDLVVVFERSPCYEEVFEYPKAGGRCGSRDVVAEWKERFDVWYCYCAVDWRRLEVDCCLQARPLS